MTNQCEYVCRTSRGDYCGLQAQECEWFSCEDCNPYGDIKVKDKDREDDINENDDNKTDRS